MAILKNVTFFVYNLENTEFMGIQLFQGELKKETPAMVTSHMLWPLRLAFCFQGKTCLGTSFWAEELLSLWVDLEDMYLVNWALLFKKIKNIDGIWLAVMANRRIKFMDV